jgi:hypothetical protein
MLILQYQARRRRARFSRLWRDHFKALRTGDASHQVLQNKHHLSSTSLRNVNIGIILNAIPCPAEAGLQGNSLFPHCSFFHLRQHHVMLPFPVYHLIRIDRMNVPEKMVLCRYLLPSITGFKSVQRHGEKGVVGLAPCTSFFPSEAAKGGRCLFF